MRQVGFKTSDNCKDYKKNDVIPSVDFQHILISGDTGSGKTSTLILPILSDRIAKNHAILFFDHKGHEHKKVKQLAKNVGRLDDVVEIGKPHCAHLNIFSELDLVRLKEVVREMGMSRDPYWSNSAANVLEDITLTYRALHDIVRQLSEYDPFLQVAESFFAELDEFGIDIFKEPTFQMIALIVSSPQNFKLYRKLIADFPYQLEKFIKNDLLHAASIKNVEVLLGKVLLLKSKIETTNRFRISEDKSDANVGNNAVLQVLDNAIAAYAKRDHMNSGEFTMNELMTKNAIIIVDTQSFGDDIMKVFFESMLKKAVMRLRNATNTAMSVFIDESNRVLFPEIDLHNDVLREASVELILAIQNEEQMMIKFGQTEWEAIKKNIKHQYFIDKHHHITYNKKGGIFSDPLLFENEVLTDVDCDYFSIEKNRARLLKGFLGNKEKLPEHFSVIYDLDLFDRESAIIVQDKSGEQYLYNYFGAAIIEEISETLPKRILVEEEKENILEMCFDEDVFDAFFDMEWPDNEYMEKSDSDTLFKKSSDL